MTKPFLQFARLRLLMVVATIALFAGLSLALSAGMHIAHASGNTWTVNDLGDCGTTICSANAGSGGPICQLRDAMNNAASGDAIVFSLSGTITLGSTLPTSRAPGSSMSD
jgi:hypothetical protein